MNKDITWCASPDCKVRCERHIFNCKQEVGEMVSIADFSGVCRDYIRRIVEEIDGEKG